MMDLGDRGEVLRKWFEQYADELCRYVRFIAPADVDPRDVVQDVFVRAFQAMHGLQRPEWARAWLYRIARNVVYDELRRRRTAARHAMWFGPQTESGMDSCVELWDAIRRLTEMQQQVLYLHAVEGLSTAEMAYALGRSATSVRVTLMRARRALAKELGWPSRGAGEYEAAPDRQEG
ncbi:MAG: sigma-70 family RNA polymerase sigma factor [Thermoflavifilum sp.]|nr:sigma-70 family RNA polymerase sigma factor [Thermoflavifilum sp.]MCL6514303.1 sigma-70 family RNA polymerase sigma factor [Alicyclobacillus sp.]